MNGLLPYGEGESVRGHNNRTKGGTMSERAQTPIKSEVT